MPTQHSNNAKLPTLRMTAQRKEILRVLSDLKNHPTAQELHVSAQQRIPTISLATIYNSLEALVDCGLIKHVHFDRESTRYCANTTEHAHYHDKGTGKIIDIPFKKGSHLKDILELPDGLNILDIEITLRGTTLPQ